MCGEGGEGVCGEGGEGVCEEGGEGVYAGREVRECRLKGNTRYRD